MKLTVIPAIALIFSGICPNKAVAGTLYINEILASNTAYLAANDEFVDWIELFNNGTSAVDLSGYYLSDDKNQPGKWVIPVGIVIAAKGYKMFYADGLDNEQHTNFRLGVEGEYIGLYMPSGAVVDSFSYTGQRNNISFGRSAYDRSMTGYFKRPTPFASNGGITYTSMLNMPVFSVNGGFYVSAQSLSISAAPGATIRYTMDGTKPTFGSDLYSEPIFIDSTMCIRAVAFMDGLLESEINTHTFFINEHKTLPVVSMVTDPNSLFSDSQGIYVIGTNGIQSGCSATPMNLNQDWERLVNIELYDENGVVKINQGAGIKIFGGCSRQRYPIKSFEIFARRQYGKGSFTSRLFEAKDIQEFESFLLRSSSDDQVNTMFRDALGHTLVSELKAETQAYQPVVLYINGQYWGIHNLREKYSEAYFEENFGVMADNLNIIENNPNYSWNIKTGNAADYLNMLSYLRTNATSTGIYEYMNVRMDIESYEDYMASQIYLGADDWPGNNIRYWKANTGRYDRWRWAFYDMDQVVMSNNSRWNSILLATTPYNGDNWPNPPWSVELFNNLLVGNKFKYEFLERICFLMNTAFSTDHMLHVIDSLQNRIAGEMPYHIERWGGQLVDDPLRESWISPLPSSMEEWEDKVGVMRTFAIDRPDTAINMLQRFFNLSDTVRITVSSSDPASGNLFMGPKRIPANMHEGVYFSGIPMAISAKPKPGYRFIRWEITPLGSSTDNISASEIYFTPIKNTHFRAVFEPYTIDGPVVVINEINYHSSDTADAADWIELYNRVPDAIDISGWILKDEKDDHSFEIPENIYLPVDGYRVICEDSTRFDRQFPTIHDRTGNFSFGLGNSGDCIRLYNATMDFVDSVHYSDEAPWPYTADGYGNTLSLIAPYLSNDLPQSWSGKYMLTPGDTNIMKPVVVPVSTSGLSDALNQNSWLEQNYPNPCAGNTTISYGLSSTGEVSLVIYDLYGRIIKSLVNEYQGPNGYKVSFNVESMAAGTYFYTLRVNHIMIQTRMMVVY